MNAQFDSGSIAMMHHNLGSYADHVKALGRIKFAGIPNPSAADGKRVTVSNPVDGLGLFRTSKNKAAAWKFIEFAVSHESNSKWNRSAAPSPPTRKPPGTRGWRRPRPLKLGAQALTDGSTAIVQLPYYLPDWNKISRSENEPGFQKVLLGTMSAKDFLDTLAKQLDAAQAEWNEQFKKD